MSANLNAPQLAANQAAPEVTVNDAVGTLDAALTEIRTVDLSAGNATITPAQHSAAVFFNCTGVATAGRTVTLNTTVRKRGLTIFECPAANTDPISLICGSTTLTLQPGRTYLVRTDGTANAITARDIGGAAEPNDLHIFVPGVMVASQLLYRMKVTRAFTLPVSLTGSFVTAVTAATASTTVTLKKNGSSIGTAVFAISGTTATLTFASPVSFASGDVLTIVGPASPDATLADTSIDLFGTR